MGRGNEPDVGESQVRAFLCEPPHLANRSPRAPISAGCPLGIPMKASPIVQRMLSEATFRYSNREFQKAATVLIAVLRSAPGVPHAFHMLGLIYEENGQMSKALKLFMMATHLSGRDARAWISLAALCERYGNQEVSIYCLQRVLAAQLQHTENVRWQRAHLHWGGRWGCGLRWWAGGRCSPPRGGARAG